MGLSTLFSAASFFVGAFVLWHVLALKKALNEKDADAGEERRDDLRDE